MFDRDPAARAGAAFGIKGGLSLSHVEADLFDTDNRTGFVGGAAAIQNGSTRVVAEGRYTFGLSNVSDLPFGGEVKNGAFYAMLGLEFPFGGR